MFSHKVNQKRKLQVKDDKLIKRWYFNLNSIDFKPSG